ncbi:hypothetical protein MLD38_013069 [Melastoma candidum]|uniref:Uncharacterized protein n=1 Tax=Melastoma candidum TaxID=119954 RepID=A0ACB9R8H5_9MYRT|nr:hypothetical protein MLD38_013069 [Melastoma candidum]
MARACSYVRLVPLASSLLIKALLVMSWHRFREPGLSWRRKAAEDAESAAALHCSGHGRAFLDGLVLDDGEVEGRCECNSCYGGPDCSEFSPNCEADANQGGPLFLEPFWMMNSDKSAVLLSGWHRMSYYYDDQSYISKRLEKTIRKLHSVVGNAVTEGKYVLFGSSSAQLLNAAIHALSSRPTTVVASVPHYEVWRIWLNKCGFCAFKIEFGLFIYSILGRFSGHKLSYLSRRNTISLANPPWINNTKDNIIEIVTSPSNPIRELRDPILNSTRGNVKMIHDRAYYWPHYTAIPAPADEDLMLFTVSKLTGHAGSRFGWALVKDEKVYQRMSEYLEPNTVGVSRDTQLRMLKILNVATEDKGRRFFKFGHGNLNRRWKALNSILSNSRRFSVQQIPPLFCTYFNKLKEPTPAYAWLKCEGEEGDEEKEVKSCHQVLKEAKIIGREGRIFKSYDQYVRLSLVTSEDDFKMLVDRLRDLVDREVESSPPLTKQRPPYANFVL